MATTTSTEVETSLTSWATVLVIRAVHAAIIAFVVLAPFLAKSDEVLAQHAAVCALMIVHWAANSDTCALTKLEAYITGRSDGETFVGRVVGPVYNLTSAHVKAATVALAAVSLARIAGRRIL